MGAAGRHSRGLVQGLRGGTPGWPRVQPRRAPPRPRPPRAGGQLPRPRRLTWQLVLSPRRLLGKRVSSETSITQEGSRQVSPSGRTRPWGGQGGGGRTPGPAGPRLPPAQPLHPAAAASERASEPASGRAGRRPAGSRLGSCLLLPPPSGSDIIPLSARRSRSADSGKQGEGWGAQSHAVGGPGGPGARAPVVCLTRGRQHRFWGGRTGADGGAGTPGAAARPGRDRAAHGWGSGPRGLRGVWVWLRPLTQKE